MIDAVTLLAITIRAAGYGAGLLAIGSGLFLIAYSRRDYPHSNAADVMRMLRRTVWIGMIAAAVAAVSLLAGLGVRAGRLSGLGLAGMTDAMMLRIVWDGPVGTAVAIRFAGLVAVASGLALFRWRLAGLLTAAGALAYASSYAFVGHAAADPRWLLGGLLALHLLALSFWLGAFAPLAMAARAFAFADAAALLHAFGRAASWAVAVLVTAGGCFAVLLVQTPEGLVATAYGRILLVKLGLVIVLLTLAALNKLRLVPALAAGNEAVRQKLVSTIRLEALAAAAILLTTAFLTSVATPPARASANDLGSIARPPDRLSARETGSTFPECALTLL